MKRHQSLASLSSDHHHGLNMARMLRSAKREKGADSAEAYLKLREFYDSELKEHFSEEEEILVPYLRSNEMIIRMCDEHAQLHKLYDSLNTTTDLNTTLIRFGELLDSHIRFEERELFPMIENTLPEEKLIEIGDRINARRGAD